MLEPLRNPANWDTFRKAAVLCIIYLWGGEGRSPAHSGR
jgi:hypothetical protein